MGCARRCLGLGGPTLFFDGFESYNLGTLDQQMKAAAANLDFEKAASLRDQIRQLRTRDLGLGPFDSSAQGGPAQPR